MTKILNTTDIKRLFLYLFGANIALIGVIISLAVYLHTTGMAAINKELDEAKNDRKELRQELAVIGKEVAQITGQLEK